MDENKIYEIDVDTDSHPVKQAEFENLELIQLINKNENYNLLLEFKDGVQFCIKAEKYHDRERIVSCLLTLRGLKFQNSERNVDHVRLIQN
jgi:transcriptional antiterminator Rof (Rho-off)